MVYDSGNRFNPSNQQPEQWNTSSSEPSFNTNRSDEKIAQSIAKPFPFPVPIPLPNLPWLNEQDVKRALLRLKNGQDPWTGEPVETEAEKTALKNLTPAQIKGMRKSKFKEDIPYAVRSNKNKRGCTCIETAVVNGGEPQTTMVKALTGADNPTLVIDPNGHAARFDGLYTGNEVKHKRLQNQLFEVEPIMPPMNKLQETQAQAHLRSKLAEWQRQAMIANTCGFGMQIAIPDIDLVRWANMNLGPVHPGMKIVEAKLGGTYGIVRANTVGGEVHHMPADEVSPVSRAKGTAIWMQTRHHDATSSNGMSKKAVDYRQEQKDLIDAGKISDAIAKDIKDVKRIAPGIYDISIQQMRKKFIRSQTNAGKK
jgi:hypothetical protein